MKKNIGYYGPSFGLMYSCWIDRNWAIWAHTNIFNHDKIRGLYYRIVVVRVYEKIQRKKEQIIVQKVLLCLEKIEWDMTRQKPSNVYILITYTFLSHQML